MTGRDAGLEAALSRFVEEAGVRLAVVVDATGGVLAQRGFTRRLDLQSASALAAAIHASSRELGRQLGDAGFGPLHHEGRLRQVFLAPLPANGTPRLLLAVFDGSSSLGIVRVFWNALASELASAAPSHAVAPPADGGFDREVGERLEALFGRG